MQAIPRLIAVLAVLLFAREAMAEPQVRVRLPERFRVLDGQLFDLRIEAWDLTGDASLRLLVNGINVIEGIEAGGIGGADVPANLPAPEITRDNDADPNSADQAWTFRGISLQTPGTTIIEAVVADSSGQGRAQSRVGVQEFAPYGSGRSVIIYIGDAMGVSFRDAGRIVAGSIGGGFREGYFDNLLEMDMLPVTGMIMTHAMDAVVPDSANTATSWSTGNTTEAAGISALPDNTDWRYRGGANTQQTKQFALDNPRVETLWQYLKRRHGYRTGVVTTADLSDATPAAAGAHSIQRALGFDIVRQFVDGSLTPGPVFDVMLGGGLQRFSARTMQNSGDARNLAAELQTSGYAYVDNRTALNALLQADRPPERLLGLFRNGDMNVAYDKLGLTRPAGEPNPNFAGFTDQPFLDEMARAALAVLDRDDRPFILLIEGASIDKQSHSNNAAGTLWDIIELDRAVGVGRAFQSARRGTPAEPLLLVTADHDQSMQILGVVDVEADDALLTLRFNAPFPNPGGWPGSVERFPDYDDPNGIGYPDNANRYRLAIGYRSNYHTAASVPITAAGPGALLFTGYYHQTDVFFRIARALGSDTSALDEFLTERDRLQPVGTER